MCKANLIVNALLETDDLPDVNAEPEANPERYLHQYADQIERDKRSGKVTAQTAQTASHFWHRKLKYAGGRRALEVRRNGATKTWKTRPGEFKTPVKYGMYEYFYITDKNADDWSTQPIPDLTEPVKIKRT